jgi:hypothetical protein
LSKGRNERESLRRLNPQWVVTPIKEEEENGKVMIQLDATRMKFIQRSLSQHVSVINMPIVRRTMW